MSSRGFSVAKGNTPPPSTPVEKIVGSCPTCKCSTLWPEFTNSLFPLHLRKDVAFLNTHKLTSNFCRAEENFFFPLGLPGFVAEPPVHGREPAPSGNRKGENSQTQQRYHWIQKINIKIKLTPHAPFNLRSTSKSEVPYAEAGVPPLPISCQHHSGNLTNNSLGLPRT